MKEINMMNECWSCVYRLNVPGDSHILCIKPDANMTGNDHGIKKGWFMYPYLFDPVWKTKKCDNFEQKSDAVSGAVSGVVSESKAQ